ncbi:MAG: TIGR04255 family protein [Elusimicrobia bacterium]|nr:TIGR04255 family protein [Elusimicrobiota bacterium]
MPNNEIYPRAPLVEAVFEIRFPGEPAIECRRNELFDFVRQDMPVVRVLEPLAGDSHMFRVYQFAAADDSQSVMAGLNVFAYSSRKYAGFEGFRAKLEPIFKFFCDRFMVKTLRRVGLRYINVIPFARENGVVPLGRYLKSSVILAPSLPQAAEVCSVGLLIPLPKGRIATRIETLKEAKTGGEALLLDFDYFKTDNLNAESLIEHLEESHQQTKEFFESIIADQYREFIRGKPLS